MNCAHCGKEKSESARYCAHCGTRSDFKVMAEDETKLWYRRWWAITLFIVVGLIVLIKIADLNAQLEAKIPKTTSSAIEKNAVAPTPNKDYVSESLPELLSKWSTYTEAKKESEWSYKYQGKYIRWKVYTKTVDDSLFGYDFLGTTTPPTQFTITSDVGVEFRSDQQTKLFRIKKGEVVFIEGKLKSYGSTFGNIFYVTDAVFLEGLPEGVSSGDDYTQASALKDQLVASCVIAGAPYSDCAEAITTEEIVSQKHIVR